MADLPEEPSRGSGRAYVVLMFLLAVAEAVVVALTDYQHWLVLVAVNALPIAALLIAKASTTLDLNKWMDSAVRIAEARAR